MLVFLCLLVVLSSTVQAAPTGFLADTPEVQKAKAEFIETFDKALSGLLSEVAPKPIEDTLEVKEAKDEFLEIFKKAVDGMIETVFNGDTDEVKEYKNKFFKTFDSALTDLFVTVDGGIYTSEQVTARKKFNQAYKDAEAGKVGAQYIEDTPAVKKAKERFFKFFQFVLDGMLYKLAPVPGKNVIPEEIADFYIKDADDVAKEKEKFDELYRNALKGDAASALAVVALEDAISNNEGDLDAAAKDLDDTLNAIADVVEEEFSNDDGEEDYDNEDDDSSSSESEDDEESEESSEEDSSSESVEDYDDSYNDASGDYEEDF